MKPTDWDQRIDSILEQLVPLDGRLLDKLVGCTDEDIERIEKEFGYQLPAAFVALLKRSGRSWGDLMRGEDFTFPELLGYRRMAESFMTEPEDPEFNQRDFVFFTHHGYQFLFFPAGQSDDPSVFYYTPDDPVFRQVYGAFTDWLDVCIKEEYELRAGKLRPRPDPGNNVSG